MKTPERTGKSPVSTAVAKAAKKVAAQLAPTNYTVALPHGEAAALDALVRKYGRTPGSLLLAAASTWGFPAMKDAENMTLALERAADYEVIERAAIGGAHHDRPHHDEPDEPDEHDELPELGNVVPAPRTVTVTLSRIAEFEILMSCRAYPGLTFEGLVGAIMNSELEAWKEQRECPSGSSEIEDLQTIKALCYLVNGGYVTPP